MNIDKITNFNNAFGNIPQVQQQATLQPTCVANNQQVCSIDAANAVMSKNAIEKQPYTFLQNINIPALNLNGNLYILPNGQKCFVAKKSGSCVIQTFFNVGSMNETDNIRGISHYIEHNLFNGSKTLKPTEFIDKVTKMGGGYNASTGANATDYYIKSPLHNPDDLEKFIQMHADMVSSPTFTPETLEKEKGVVIKEIQMIEDNPYNIASNISMKNLFNIKTKSNDIVGGSVENIANLTRNDVVNYYNTYYNPKNALTVIIGDVDEKKTMELLSKNFKDFKASDNQPVKYYENLQAIQKSVRQDVYSAKTEANIIKIGFAGPKNNESKRAVDALLIALTGYDNAKLTKALRDLNLNVQAGSEQMSNANNAHNYLSFCVSTAKNNAEEVLKLMYKTIHEIAYKPLTNEELNIIKGKMLTRLKYSAESNMDISSMLASSYLTNGNFNSVINIEKEINALTAQDIMNAAKKYLDLNKASICVVHPQHNNNVSFKGNNRKILGDIKTYKTHNNAEINIQHSPDSKIYSINFELTSPKAVKHPAIFALLSRMLFKGNTLTNKDEYFDLKDKANIDFSLMNSYNKMRFNYKCPKESFNLMLDCFNKDLYYPALTQENFEKAKAEIKNTYLSDSKSPYDKAIETLYAGTPKNNSGNKIYNDIDKISLNDVIIFYKEFIQNARIDIHSTGDYSDKNLLNSLYYSISNNGKIYNSNTVKPDFEVKSLDTTQVVTDTQEYNQANILQMFRIKETSNIKDTAAINLLNEILGGNSNSRLFNDLREKQKLAYRVSSSYSLENETDNEGVLTLNILTTTDDPNNPKQSENLQKAINGFNYHIKKLVNEKVKQDELDAAKIMLKSRLISMTDSTVGKNILLANSMNSLYKTKYMDEALKAIDAITVDDIQKIAQYYLTKPSVISVVASKNTLKNNEKYLNDIKKGSN